MADVAIYGTTTAEWLIRGSSNGALVWGAPTLGDNPTRGQWSLVSWARHRRQAYLVKRKEGP